MIKEYISCDKGFRNVSIFCSNGKIEITSTYDPNGRLIKQWVYEGNGTNTLCSAEYDGLGNLVCKYKFFYKLDFLVEKIVLDSNNRVTAKYIYKNDEQGRALTAKKYDSNNTLLYYFENVWGEVECLKTTCRNSNGDTINKPFEE